MYESQHLEMLCSTACDQLRQNNNKYISSLLFLFNEEGKTKTEVKERDKQFKLLQTMFRKLHAK